MSFRRFLKFCIIHLPFCILIVTCSSGFAGIKDTKHNLSVSGPGTIKATKETDVCVFCHIPHNANPSYPLWGHEITDVDFYTHYTSPYLVSYTSESDAPPIDGISRLCLSCHDGTIALGATINSQRSEIEMNVRFMPSDAPGYLGTNLSGGHPISIIYDESLMSRRALLDAGLMQLNWPIVDRDVKLYPTQGGYGVQCSSCHDPHGGKGGSGAPPFWQKTTYDDVCLVCHDRTSSIGH